MKRLPLAAAAGLTTASAPAAAQEHIDFTLNWLEVTAGTNTPVPNPNSILEPGESARLSITVSFTPQVGASVSYTPPPGSGSGTMAGFGIMILDLCAGPQGMPSTSGLGTWSEIRRAGGWAIGSGGEPHQGGACLEYMLAGQLALPGGPINPANPIIDIWQGVWTPETYTARSVPWQTYPSAAAPGPAVSLIVQYGTDPLGNPLYAAITPPTTFGSTTIPIIPAPASAFLLIPLLSSRRRHTRGSV